MTCEYKCYLPMNLAAGPFGARALDTQHSCCQGVKACSRVKYVTFTGNELSDRFKACGVCQDEASTDENTFPSARQHLHLSTYSMLRPSVRLLHRPLSGHPASQVPLSNSQGAGLGLGHHKSAVHLLSTCWLCLMAMALHRAGTSMHLL